MKKKLMKTFGKLHLWLGLGSGLIVFIVALTGSIMVFEKEIDQYINSDFYFVSTIGKTKKPIDYCTDLLQKEYSIKKITRISTFNDPKRTLLIVGKDMDGESIIFAFDPYSGKILGSVDQETRFFSIVLSLHRHLLLDDIGKLITGISCLIFAFMLISGLILWWPKKIKNLKQRLTVKWGASFKRINWDFHSTFGFYSFLFLLTISLTGLVFAFDWFEKGIYYFADGTTKKLSNKVENPNKTDPKLNKTAFYQTIYNQADSIFDYQGNIQIRMPADTINSILVLKENVEKTIPFQSSAAYFDKYTAEIIESRPYENFSRGDKIRRLIYPIHSGSIYGYPTKIIAFLVCLFALTLPVSGFLIWWGRKKK
ncbi:PepSY-associated TM helix domain-containing protein [Flavobacterium sp. Fl-77]|uniref:PepSY-associated TM helix domain-containing protein n=1 Tax=Flavobacterium flavipigmentatum TaxID=2893884 RepID=A0AAJ2SDH0_9FLAO|nr:MULTISPECIES: PepSY-associated TM helix domain-containing protein [unclassified Flavobacterium]MDX6182888.1 PepSY-associated TM helix domain-containing protein [Flavobacterium sp. Fl-33]MDX6186341.1 PepSY-associated TM helix domain-containing protein [Flavobacterium sp. Fl-77]UFH37871.1 PepSY domain-containing protein [Flavobacterium sp. F-70]